MNRIITTDIVDPNIQQPFTGKSLKFLQDSIENQLAYNLLSVIGEGYSPSIPYAIYGCKYVGSVNTPSSVGGGYIFYDAKIYVGLVRGTAVATGATYEIVQTQDGVADPLKFTDNVDRNVHNIYSLQIVDQTLGTGLFNLSDVVYISDPLSWTNFSLLNSWTSIATPKYRKLKDAVSFSGTATNATLANASLPIFTLPVGSRPAVDLVLPVVIVNAGNSYTRGLSIDSTNGNCTINDTTGFTNTTTDIYLNGLQFFIS